MGEVASLVLTLIAITKETNVVELQKLLSTVLDKHTHSGVLYNTLKRLENAGLVKAEKAVLTRVDMRNRKIYSISEKGRIQFRTEQRTRKRLKKFAKENYGMKIH